MCVHAADLQFSSVSFLPIVSAYACRIGLVEEIDRLLDCEMEVSPGRMVLAMILDALSGRSPLFRVGEFFQDKDVELLLGEDIPLSKITDDTLGRVLDRISYVGPNKVLGAIILRVMKIYDLDTSHVHQDTTSHSVYGDYLLYDTEGHGLPFVITRGNSKDHRPDLKQLVQNVLCVDYGIPIYTQMLDGNASDKTINKNLIPEMVKRMRLLGCRTFIYVADSALVTGPNLELIDDWDNGFLFASRLPLSYNECRDAITRAVASNAWEEIGVISGEPHTINRKPAFYRAFETIVTLYGINYRAVVIHSDAYDNRSQKNVDKDIAKDRKELNKLKKRLEKINFACLPDAEAEVNRIPPASFHELTVEIEPRPKYYGGRLKAGATRRIKEMRYGLKISFQIDQQKVDEVREEAGCFVLITNTLAEGTDSVPARDLLTTYMDQQMVERNFGFLKDPVFVNSLFLK
jgi:transposase